MLNFIQRQISHIRRGGRPVFVRKCLKVLTFPLLGLSCLLAVPLVLLVRFVRPFVLIRFGVLPSEIIGVFALVPEIYLCERDAGTSQPSGRHVDIWCFGSLVCNRQIALMWRRVFTIWPYWFVKALLVVSRHCPGGEKHEIKMNKGRDALNLTDRFPPHIQFNSAEESFGQSELRRLGVEEGARFVCILARDGLFQEKVNAGRDWSYHDYRNTDVNNYVLVAEELANLDYFVLRMGSVAKDRLKLEHPKVIDYATNGMRSEFMDVYLGAKCEFCVTMGSGWDSIPHLFRRPIVYVNFVPLGYIYTSSSHFISITRRHWSINDDRELTLSEILSRGAGSCLSTSDYQSQGVVLIENTPGEIRDVVIEMVGRLNGSWRPHEDDDALQERFWSIFIRSGNFPDGIHPRSRDGILAYFGADFLRQNRAWLK